MRIPRPRLNLLELALWALLLVGLAGMGGFWYGARHIIGIVSRDNPEFVALRDKYGPGHHSQSAEEWIVRDYFQDQRDGMFVDVGANHYLEDSNTYYLETALGWHGIAIEPQIKFLADYQTHRPRTQFVPLFVSDKSNEKAVLYVPRNDQIASTSKAFIDAERGGDATPMEVNTTTLDDVLTRADVTRLDFLSIDVELHEPEVLRGFSIERWKPRLICIESHAEVRQFEIDYFMQHGYVLLGKYLRADPVNLWFAPAS